MKLPTLILAILIAGRLVAADDPFADIPLAPLAPSVPSLPPTPGRYQLVAATVLMALQPAPCLFRIDTVTGQTWIYGSAALPMPSSISPKPTAVTYSVEGWTPIGSYPVAFSNYLALYYATNTTTTTERNRK